MTERAQALEAIDRMLSYMVINAEDRRILRAEIAALPVQAPAEGVSPQPPDDEDDPGETCARCGEGRHLHFGEHCLSSRDVNYNPHATFAAPVAPAGASEPPSEQAVCKSCRKPVEWNASVGFYLCEHCGRRDGSALCVWRRSFVHRPHAYRGTGADCFECGESQHHKYHLSTPVVPEPPTEPLSEAERHELQSLKALVMLPTFTAREREIALTVYRALKGAPAPCVWREKAEDAFVPACRDIAPEWFCVGEMKDWACCPYCKAPLTVER